MGSREAITAGTVPGQEGNQVMVSACPKGRPAACDCCPHVPPPHLFYLALHCSYRGAGRTTEKLSGTTWFSEKALIDLILEVLPVTKAMAPGVVLRRGAISLPFRSVIAVAGTQVVTFMEHLYAKTLCQRLLMPIGIKTYPLQLRWAKRNPTLYFLQLILPCFQSPSPRMV